MAWLRLDDGFTDHRKVVALKTDQRRWTWLRILIYTARYRSPEVPAGIRDVIAEATPKFLAELVDIGLIDEGPNNSLTVHDWHDYQPKDPTKAERQARWRAKNAESVDAPVDGAVDAPVDGDVDASRVGARARPVPSPTPKTKTKADAGLTALNYDEPASASSTEARTTDPLGKLVLELRDRDAGTEHVFRAAFGGLPEAAFEYTREEILRCRGTIDSDCGTARRILDRIVETGDIGDPDFAPTNDVTSSAAAATSTCPHCGTIPGGPRTLAEHMHVSHGEPLPDQADVA